MLRRRLVPEAICTWKPDAWIGYGDGVAVLAKLSYAERGRSPSNALVIWKLAISKHRYVVEPGGTGQVNVTTISKLIDDGKSSAFAGAAVKIALAGGNYREEWAESGEQGTRVHGYMENLPARQAHRLPTWRGRIRQGAQAVHHGRKTRELIIPPEFVVVSPEHGLRRSWRPLCLGSSPMAK